MQPRGMATISGWVVLGCKGTPSMGIRCTSLLCTSMQRWSSAARHDISSVSLGQVIECVALMRAWPVKTRLYAAFIVVATLVLDALVVGRARLVRLQQQPATQRPAMSSRWSSKAAMRRQVGYRHTSTLGWRNRFGAAYTPWCGMQARKPIIARDVATSCPRAHRFAAICTTLLHQTLQLVGAIGSQCSVR